MCKHRQVSSAALVVIIFAEHKRIKWRDARGTILLTIVFVCGTISFEKPGFCERMTQVASTGPSQGADEMVMLAKAHGRQVFSRLEEVPGLEDTLK
jgi:hypothetical protein